MVLQRWTFCIFTLAQSSLHSTPSCFSTDLSIGLDFGFAFTIAGQLSLPMHLRVPQVQVGCWQMSIGWVAVLVNDVVCNLT